MTVRQAPAEPGPKPPLAASPPVLTGPPPPPLFQRWPIRSAAAGSTALVAVVVAGVVGALTLPGRPGVGWLLTGLAIAGGLVAVVLDRRRAQVGAGVGSVTGAAGAPVAAAGWGLAAVALLSVGTVRAAGWLFFLCVLTALLAFTLAVAGGRTVIGLMMAPITVFAAMFRGLPWLRRALSPPAAGVRQPPGADRPAVGADRSGVGAAVRTIAALVVGCCLLLVFGALFSAADPAFAALVQRVLPELSVSTAVRWIFVGGLVAVLTLAGAFLLANPTEYGDATAPPPVPLRRIEWALPVGLLVALFALFVSVQAAVLFGGRDYVLDTAGLTFAAYARRGFWQLLLVTLLTLAVIAVAARKASRAGRTDRIVLRCLLGALTAGALVVVASALWRMGVYEQAYGFTRLRIFVSAFELWLGVLLVLVLVAGVRLRAGWLPRAVVGTWVGLLLALAVLNPDRFVAERNIDRYFDTGRTGTARIDVRYLNDLSADAAPELARLPASLRACELGQRLSTEPDRWYEYNAARAWARSHPRCP